MNSDDLIYYYKNSGKFYGISNFNIHHLHTWMYDRIDEYDDFTIFQLGALTHYVRDVLL